MKAGVGEDIETLIAGRDSQSGGWAETSGEVWVTDGPVHGASGQSIPGGEPVPVACWMVVLRHDGDGWTSLSFEVPNQTEPREPARFLVPIEPVERDAGSHLEPALPAEQRPALEQARHDVLWR